MNDGKRPGNKEGHSKSASQQEGSKLELKNWPSIIYRMNDSHTHIDN